MLWSGSQACKNDYVQQKLNSIQSFLTAKSEDRPVYLQAKTFLDVLIRLPNS